MFKTIINSKAEILSAMGVIEHLRYPHKLFQAFRKSKIKYLYYSVPMFSMSALLENAFKKVFPRQLSGGHTHLYTEESILKMNEIIGIESIAEWRFGTDAMDLFRSLLVTMNANKVSNNTTKFFSSKFIKVLDKFQKLLDKNHFCSEIHLLGCKSKVEKLNPDFFHIGYPRTGTTFLQSSIFKQCEDKIFEKSKVLSFTNGKEFKNSIYKDVSSTKVKNKIFLDTEEEFSGDMFRDNYQFPSHIYDINKNAKIILTVRSQYSILPSIYSLFIKKGGKLDFDEYIKIIVKNKKFDFDILYKEYLKFF